MATEHHSHWDCLDLMQIWACPKVLNNKTEKNRDGTLRPQCISDSSSKS